MPAHSKLNPLIDEFLDAKSHAARADALLRMPVLLICRLHDNLATACDKRGFVAGAEYVATLYAAMWATRDAAGQPPKHISAPLAAQEECLRRIAAGPEPMR